MSFTLDWDDLSSPSQTLNLNDGGETLGVTVASDANWSLGDIDGDDALRSSGNTSDNSTLITFDQAVTDLTFELFDIDQGSASSGASTSWDDQVTIIARDYDGNIIEIPASAITNETTHTITSGSGGTTIDSEGNDDPGVEGSGAADTVTVTIPGPIASIEIIHQVGDDGATSTGTIGISNMTVGAIAPVVDEDIVDGEETGETMVLGYNDADGPTDGGGDLITTGDDIIEGNDGDDTIEGDAGNDVIYGGGADELDGGRAVFEWSELSDSSGGNIDDGETLNGTQTQDTGGVTVTYSQTNNGTSNRFETDDQNVDGIETIGVPLNDNSALKSNAGDDGDAATYMLDFSDAVTDVDFRVNDIDFDSVVQVRAFDAAGNEIPVVMTASSTTDLDISNIDNAEVSADGSGATNTDGDASVLVEIAGPVARIEIIHSNDGGDGSAVTVSDVFFNTIDDDAVTTDGNDTLIGGTGDDIMYAGGQDDDLIVGSGDVAYGGHGDDEFIIDPTNTDGPGTITLVGGETGEGDPSDTENDDYVGADNTTGDILDLRGLDIVDPSVIDPTSESGSFEYVNDGGDTVTVNYSEIENVIICFTAGTLIRTAKGDIAIEDLAIGDRVITKDHGMQPLRWVGSRKVPATGNLAPVVIKAGAMSNDTDLAVSPQHRMLVEGWKSELLFGRPEVLAAAKHLVNGDTIYVAEGGEVEYFHILFDTHEIVYANGAPSESFHPGEVGFGALAEEAREEILTLFPELRSDMKSFGASARESLKAHEAQTLADNPDFLK